MRRQAHIIMRLGRLALCHVITYCQLCNARITQVRTIQANSIVQSTELLLSIGNQSPIDTTFDRSVPSIPREFRWNHLLVSNGINRRR
jgi:hypothetical protein